MFAQPVPNGCCDVARRIILINQRLVGAFGEGWEGGRVLLVLNGMRCSGQ